MGNKRNKERKMNSTDKPVDENAENSVTIPQIDAVNLNTAQDVGQETTDGVALDGGSAASSGAESIAEEPKPVEIKVGSVVDLNQGKLGKEASKETKERVSKASTATQDTPALSAFEQKLQEVNATGTDREKFVASMVGEYVRSMAPGTPVAPDEGFRRQMALSRTIISVIENEKDFTSAFRLLIAFVREHRKGVFSDSYAYRFFEFARPGDNGPKVLTNLLTVLIVAAGLQNKRELKKFVSLEKALALGISEEGRQRVLRYFNS